MTTVPEQQVSAHLAGRTPRRGTERFVWEGLALAGAGVAFVAKALFDFDAGDPPSNGTALLGWMSNNKLALSMSDELLVIAAVLMIPGLLGLRRSLLGSPHRGGPSGLAITAATIPAAIIVSVFGGRLVFPMYGIELTDPDSAKLAAGLYFGGQHATLLILGVGTAITSLAMRDTRYGRMVVSLGLVTAVADVAGSYPDLIGRQLTLLTALLLGTWAIAVGARLVKVTPFGDITNSMVPSTGSNVASG
jgi:hypothetical protein